MGISTLDPWQPEALPPFDPFSSSPCLKKTLKSGSGNKCFIKNIKTAPTQDKIVQCHTETPSTASGKISKIVTAIMKPAAMPWDRPRLRFVIPLDCIQTITAPSTVATPLSVLRKRARGKEEVASRVGAGGGNWSVLDDNGGDGEGDILLDFSMERLTGIICSLWLEKVFYFHKQK
jgi:hypothetical protein